MPVFMPPGRTVPVTVPDGVDVSTYVDQGWEIVSGPAPKATPVAKAETPPVAPAVDPDDVPSDDWKVSELTAYAKAHDIEVVGDARKKADILKSIADARNS